MNLFFAIGKNMTVLEVIKSLHRFKTLLQQTNAGAGFCADKAAFAGGRTESCCCGKNAMM
jgi:hypothetical protein